MNEHVSDETSANSTTASQMFQDNLPGYVKARSSSAASVSGTDEVSELGTPRHGKDKHYDQIMDNSTSGHDLINPSETALGHATSREDFIYKDNSTDKVTEYNADAIALHLDGTEFTPAMRYYDMNAHDKRLSPESIESDSTTTTLVQDAPHDFTGRREPSRNSDLLLTFQLDERHKLNKILNTQKQRLDTARADVEDLIARLNQEMAARQYLVIKVSSTSLGFFIYYCILKYIFSFVTLFVSLNVVRINLHYLYGVFPWQYVGSQFLKPRTNAMP